MKTKLDNIENERDVPIIYACESGSRAWGFASPDSDYDVRFLYTKPLEWYLSISDKRDTIDILEGDFDAVGWELRKSLILLKKSNVPAIEHLFSPIIYSGEDEIVNELRAIASECFSPIACMYHYLSMSKKYAEKLGGEHIKLKDLFYALRTSLAGTWILEHKTMPPVIFSEMLSLLTDDLAGEIRDLIVLKSRHNESYMHSRNEDVIRLVSDTIATNDRYAKSLASGKPDTERINALLYKCITEN